MYLEEMAAVENKGPGSLELNPSLQTPEYTRHEIHIQPGGYLGGPFAGHLYHYGTNGFYSGRNHNDELHVGSANRLPVPRDGKVLRILDLGRRRQRRLGQLKDGRTMNYAQVKMAKRNNVRVAREGARLAREMHGGNGITTEYPIIRHMLNLETVDTYEGTHDIHTLIVGRDLTGLNAVE